MSNNSKGKHIKFSNNSTSSGRNLDPFSKENSELRAYRTSVPEGPQNNWRLYPRWSSSIDPKLNPNLSHLSESNREFVSNTLNRQSQNRQRTLKTPRLAKYLANIEAKYNNPRNMKNYVDEIPNSNLTSYERSQLIKNIDGRYPAENYPTVFNGKRASRTLAPRASNAARLKADQNGAPEPPVFNPANVFRNLKAAGSARGGTKKHRKTRSSRGRK